MVYSISYPPSTHILTNMNVSMIETQYSGLWKLPGALNRAGVAHFFLFRSPWITKDIEKFFQSPLEMLVSTGHLEDSTKWNLSTVFRVINLLCANSPDILIPS